MPTIPQLPTATQTSVQDEMPISQGGVTRAVTVAELLSGTQALINIPSPTLLGRASLGPGSPEALSVGLGLGLQGAAVIANGADHGSFPQESSFSTTDEMIVNAEGAPKCLPVSALLKLFSAGSNLSISATGVINATTDASVTGTLSSLNQAVTTIDAALTSLSMKIPANGFAGLNSNGQVTAPIASDASAATVLAASDAIARTLSARALDFVNLLDFGSTTGGVDCSTTFNAALAQLPVTGGELFIPAGDYLLVNPIVVSGKAVSIRGAGRGQTRIHFQHTGIGFDFAPGNLFSKILLQGVSLYAESSVGQTAAGVRITYPASSAFALMARLE